MGDSTGTIFVLLFLVGFAPFFLDNVFAEKDVADSINENLHPNLAFSLMDSDQLADSFDVGVSPIELSINPSTNTIYVTNRDDSISVINGNNNSISGKIEVGASPRGVAVNPVTNHIYVTKLLDNSISVIDGSNHTIVETIEVGAFPRGVAVDPVKNTIYVTNSMDNTISIIDGYTNSVVDTLEVDTFPRGIVVNPLTNTIYVTHPLSDSISVIDGSNQTVTETIIVEGGSFGISLNPETNKIYAVSCFYDDNSISVIDGSNNLVVDTIDSEKCALALAVNPISNTIYMPDSNENTILVMSDEYTIPKKANKDISCKEGLQLIIRTNGDPACVKPATAEKFQSLGWAIIPTKAPELIPPTESETDKNEVKYKMAENVAAKFSFTFRDGRESYEFPVFRMTSDLVENVGTTFAIEGIIGNSPHLHQALDAAYKYRVMTVSGSSSFEFDYRFFDVEVDLTRDDKTIRTYNYYNCEVLDYQAVTLNSNDYESYTSSNTGFAVVDKIEFRCGGVNGETPEGTSFQNIDYGEIYDFSENVRTFITFEFDDGIETIEFPSFKLNSGFEESNDSVLPSFSVQGVVDYYPLLYNAVDKAIKVSGIGTASNPDFEAFVEFTNGEKTLRTLDFRDCRVSGAIVNTESDKEEGYTGKSGFAIVNEIDFDCAGLKPTNGDYKELRGDVPIWKNILVTNSQFNSDLRMAEELRVVATFNYDDGVETLEFPIFRQGEVLNRGNPTFELEGIVGDYPLLYKRVDENLKIQSVSGANLMTELFDIDVNLIHNETIRSFEYSNCRVTDYVIASDNNAEETYIKGVFALENTFEFECQGFHPKNPMYDLTFGNSEKAHTKSTKDLRETHDWESGFYVE